NTIYAITSSVNFHSTSKVLAIACALCQGMHDAWTLISLISMGLQDMMQEQPLNQDRQVDHEGVINRIAMSIVEYSGDHGQPFKPDANQRPHQNVQQGMPRLDPCEVIAVEEEVAIRSIHD